jgi:hypothetical protein
MVDSSKNTLDKKGNIRFDYLFSYWIFAWFLVFYFVDKGTTAGKWIYKYLNPTIALWIALMESLVTFVYLLILHPRLDYTIKMLAMMFFIKAFPLYLIRRYPIHWKNDILVTLILFAIYNVYLYFNDTNVIDIYRRTFTAFKEGTNQTPLFSLMDSLYKSLIFS